MIVWQSIVGIMAVIALVVVFAAGYLVWQGSRKPDASGAYVALGSSFAAGFGLGPRAPGSPMHCFRSRGGYPTLLAKQLGLRLVDMTCTGSTTEHILRGGPLFLGPQIAAIGPGTRLVTITSGGNDVDYVGDLMAASGAMGRMGRWWHGPAKPAASRPYDAVAANLAQIIAEIRRRAPEAHIVLASYPPILPQDGTCAELGISERQAEMSREVARRLADATRLAARQSGVMLVEMDAAGASHDACSDEPWVNGPAPAAGAAFHPTTAGAAATAEHIGAALRLNGQTSLRQAPKPEDTPPLSST